MGRKWTPEQRARQSEAIKAHWERKKRRRILRPHALRMTSVARPYDWYRRYRLAMEEHKKDPFGIFRFLKKDDRGAVAPLLICPRSLQPCCSSPWPSSQRSSHSGHTGAL